MDFMQALSTVILIAYLACQPFGYIRTAIGPVNQNNQTIQNTAISPAPIDDFPAPKTCINGSGTVFESSMDSRVFHAPVKYSIYLPPCYDEKAEKRYPVLYLLNGQTYNNQQWIQLGLADVADELINDRRIVPMIIVMPNDPDWRQPDESPFGHMLVDEMIPFIDQTYPTLPERQYRAIGGLSRGASWALHLGLTEWQLFSRIGAHSLPVFTMDSPYIPKWLDEIPPGSAPQLYIDMGNQDPELNTARAVERLLSDRHLPHEWHMFIGTHEEAYWKSHLPKYLLWYACEWAVLYYN
jgi:enterochelin esterase-like enzyme